MSTVLLIAALALVSIWTARLAKSKGRNPWLWGGASFVLGIPTIHLFAVAPLIIIMFLKKAPEQAGPIVQTTTCPKCQSSSAKNSRFCTNCGWEVARVNTLDTPQEVAEPIVAPSTQTQEPAEVSRAPTQDNTQSPAQSSEAAVESSTDDVAEYSPVTAPVHSEIDQLETVETDSEPTGEPAAEETLEEITSYRKIVPVDAPTAAVMTERGVRLFNQGRTQEAIDQFTKAIALDATYIEAWAKRAEAYALLGRGDQAAEDQRRLDSLNASSP
ncbi:MAG: hypothetical protein BZY75_04270 [SAR202 cluster bacterium Io17-Chloro-G7]|nr:MAG: hypothetical protein BZY75_04270 [SAR202 cluster bacterium Io17-Chloro-G7]